MFAQQWQNVTTDYIKNPSFEEYTYCPEGLSQPSQYWIDSCVGWTAATYSTPDYINACANVSATSVGVPSNFPMGYQSPYHGQAYCGFVAHSFASTTGGMWCEYLESKFIKPLVAKQKYKWTMRINSSNNNFYGIEKIGVNFSNNKLVSGFQETSFKFAPTLINTKGIIDDTLNWFLFEEEFIANGNEKHITIGWFCDTLTNDHGYFDTIVNQTIYGDTYYAIDSINLIEEIFTIENFNINVLTPNNDGANDVIDFSNYNLTSLSFIVYNRWGNKIFESNDPNLKWNGVNQQNETLTDGTYFYILQAIKNKAVIRKKQFLSIIN